MTPGRGLYKIKTIAELSGFTPTLLRAWERRYEILEPERTDTGHRLYTEDDLRVLHEIRHRLDAGRSIGEVVAQGRVQLLRREQRPLAPELGLEGLRSQLLQAICDLDEVALQQVLDQSFAILSTVTVLEQLLERVCHEVGLLWASGKLSVAHEHLLSAVFSRRLQRLLDYAGPTAGRGVLCACMPGEQHELGIMVVTYRLRALGLGATCLGRDLPLDDLILACRHRDPTHVFLSVTRPENLAVEALRRFATEVHAPVIVGGRGVGPEAVEPLSEAGLIPWPTGRALDELVYLVRGPLSPR